MILQRSFRDRIDGSLCVLTARSGSGQGTIFNDADPVYYFTDALQFLSYLSVSAAACRDFRRCVCSRKCRPELLFRF
jgi:hypothetical protein